MKKLLSLMAISPMVITACGGASEAEKQALYFEYLDGIEIQHLEDYIPETHLDKSVKTSTSSTNVSTDTFNDIVRSIGPINTYFDKVNSLDNSTFLEEKLEMTKTALKAGEGREVIIYKELKDNVISYTLDKPESFIFAEKVMVSVAESENGYKFTFRSFEKSTNGTSWIQVNDLAGKTEFSIFKEGSKYVYGADINSMNNSTNDEFSYLKETKYGSDNSIQWSKASTTVSSFINTNKLISSELTRDDDGVVSNETTDSTDSIRFSVEYDPEAIVNDMPQYNNAWDYWDELTFEQQKSSKYATYLSVEDSNYTNVYDYSYTASGMTINRTVRGGSTSTRTPLNGGSEKDPYEHKYDNTTEIDVSSVALESFRDIANRNYSDSTEYADLWRAFGIPEVKVGYLHNGPSGEFIEQANLSIMNPKVYLQPNYSVDAAFHEISSYDMFEMFADGYNPTFYIA